MNQFISDITRPENLYWAWLKAQSMYEYTDILTSDFKRAEFELNLSQELESIRQDLIKGCYSVKPLQPIAHPKSKDEKGDKRIRQAFLVDIRDQVTWIAIVNILGPFVEDIMPRWSYGNRLYRQIFFEDDDKQPKFGHYRHAKGRLYRSFQQSWPIYRRHILFTARKMMGDRIALDNRDSEFLEQEERLGKYKLKYLQKGWWNKSYKEVYWGSIDFKQFYPKINLEVIRQNLSSNPSVSKIYKKDDVGEVLKSLLEFPLDLTHCTSEHLELIELPQSETTLSGLPTGLFVSGLLANVGMLGLDLKIDSLLKTRQIAHFRYVDDHTILAPSFEDLNSWIEEYMSVVERSGLEAELNTDKTEPNELKEYRKANKDNKEKEDATRKATRLDERMPTPLLTKTLAKVSQVANVQMDFLTTEEQDGLLNDIEHLLVTEFPEEELRPDTRMSFAMSQLCKAASHRFLQSKEAWTLEDEIAKLIINSSGSKKRYDSKSLNKLQKDRKNLFSESFERHFKFILLTLERYPEKPRLWEKAVKFCLRTGHALGLRKLFETLDRHNEIHEESIKYLRLFILQQISQNLLKSISIILDSNQTICQRVAAVRFANEAYELSLPKFLTHNPFEIIKVLEVCRHAYALMCQLVQKKNRASYNLEETFLFLHQQGLLASLPLGKKSFPLNNNDNHDIAVCNWLIDNTITSFDANVPSFYWMWYSIRLSPTYVGNWSFIQKWPNFVPIRCINPKLQPDSARHGWFVEALDGKGTGPFNSPTKDYITLSEWVKKCSKFDNWDPRRSEWTALEIIRQAIASKSSFSLSNNNALLIPSNILIPIELINEADFTWESWYKAVEENIVRLREEDIVYDERYIPFWMQVAGVDDPWSQAYAAGLTLFGLVRLDFSLPARWNPDGQMRLWGYGLRRIITNITCSSYSLAILEACILPRNRETSVLKALKQVSPTLHVDDDTRCDPPDIPNIDRLKSYIEKAQQVLKMHHITVQNHKPRQLIPISIDQIGRSLFDEDIMEHV